MQCTIITDSLSTKPARRIPRSERHPSRNHESRWSSCGFGPLVEPRAGGGGPRSGCCLGSGPVVWYIGRSCGPVACFLLLFDTRVVSYVGGKSSKNESDFDKPCPYRKSIVRNQSPSNMIYRGHRPSLPSIPKDKKPTIPTQARHISPYNSPPALPVPLPFLFFFGNNPRFATNPRPAAPNPATNLTQAATIP